MEVKGSHIILELWLLEKHSACPRDVSKGSVASIFSVLIASYFIMVSYLSCCQRCCIPEYSIAKPHILRKCNRVIST
jgi:hypothetical protein